MKQKPSRRRPPECFIDGMRPSEWRSCARVTLENLANGNTIINERNYNIVPLKMILMAGATDDGVKRLLAATHRTRETHSRNGQPLEPVDFTKPFTVVNA